MFPLLLSERPAVYIVKIAGTMNSATNCVIIEGVWVLATGRIKNVLGIVLISVFINKR